MAQMVKDQQLMRESGMTSNGISTKGLESASGSQSTCDEGGRGDIYGPETKKRFGNLGFGE